MKASSKSCRTKTSPESFNEAYYKSGNYVDYLERGPRYERTAHELASFLRSVGLITRGGSYLDFGCGVGLLSIGFAQQGISVSGTDVSKWALERAKEHGVDTVLPYKVRGMFALDVFEHMRDSSIVAALKRHSPRFLVVRIPVARFLGEDFHLAVSRADKTHINCKTAIEWERWFERQGYLSLRLSLHTLYCSDGVYCALLVRKTP